MTTTTEPHPTSTDTPAAGTAEPAATGSSPGSTAAPGPRPRRLAKLLLGLGAIVVAAFAVVLWGGYTQGWTWTGVEDTQTLWDWLQLLLVPIAFATLPIWLRRHEKIRRDRKIMLVGALLAFAAFVAAGYLVPWEWTGFPGNTLWDWLTLLLLPVAIVSVRFLHAERTLLLRHYVIGALLAVVFVVVVICGYLVPWEWTGFTGNTVIDWFKLLVLPIGEGVRDGRQVRLRDVVRRLECDAQPVDHAARLQARRCPAQADERAAAHGVAAQHAVRAEVQGGRELAAPHRER